MTRYTTTPTPLRLSEPPPWTKADYRVYLPPGTQSIPVLIPPSETPGLTVTINGRGYRYTTEPLKNDSSFES